MSDSGIEFCGRDFRAIIAFHYMKNIFPKEALEQINAVLGENTVSYNMVKTWFRLFKCGRTSLADEPRSGRPVEVTTEKNALVIPELVKEEPRVTALQIAGILKISEERVHNIMKNILGMRYLCVRWVPHLLNDEQRALRLKMCKENLKMFELEGPNIINKLVTGDETWVYFYDNLTSQEVRLWVLEDEDIPSLPKKEVHVKKVMFAIFFRSTGIVQIVRKGSKERINADWYTTKCLPKVFQSLIESRPISQLKGIILHHDNASSHTSSVTKNFLKESGVKFMAHPPY